MKIKNLTIIKKMILVLLFILILGNFIMPGRVQADAGGTLTKPIFQFVAWIGDVALNFMQNVFIGEDEITEDNENYEIKYSPGVIFDGNVLAFDVNFIDPDDREIVAKRKFENCISSFDSYFKPEYDDEFRCEKELVENLREYGYTGPDANRLNFVETNTEGTEEMVVKNAEYYAKTAKYKIDGDNTEYTYDEFCKKLGEIHEKLDEKKDKKKKLTVSLGGYDYEEEFLVLATYNVVGEEKKYSLYASIWGESELSAGVNIIIETDGTTGKGKSIGQTGAAGSSINDDFVKQLKANLSQNMTYSDEQIEAGESSEVDFYQKLRDDDLFGYNWCNTNKDTALTWKSSKDGETYMLGFSKDGIPGIYTSQEEERVITSTAKQLQGTVASWYKALRTFALVGLLSVLVYIGIRIIISSSTDDKAKYKKMLANWVAAVCIVFILHYIMVFILNISNSINEVFQVEVIDESGNDTIMSDLRTKMKNTDDEDADFTGLAGTTVCYLALVIYTGIFSVQYLKRVIYMAFLTMIAPLIALTYPLDKIKDGKAQAFSMWLKEYIFNALLQPIHLLLYYMLIGTAVNFAFTNPLYAVVATGFLVPAEKFFRKMFGMESQTSVGTIGAAAGGAMVMSMLNKMKAKPPKEEGEKQAKVRTADPNIGGAQPPVPTPVPTPAPAPMNPPRRTNQDPANQTPVNTLGAPIDGETPTSGGIPAGEGAPIGGRTPTGEGTPTGEETPTSVGAPTGEAESTSNVQTPNRRQRFTRATHAVASKYIYGKDARKKAWKGMRRTITGAVGGLAAGTIGLAAGVATGDAGKAFQYAATGAAAGYIGASNLAESAWSGTKGMADTFNKGYKGTESYNNAQFDKQFFKSDDYTMIAEDPQIAANGIDPKEAVQGYLSQGVTDGGQIRKLLQKGIGPDTYKEYADVGMKDPDKIRQLNKAHINATDYNDYVKNAHVRDIDKMEDLKAAQISAKDYKELDEAGISNINTIKKYKEKGKSVEKMKQMKKIAKLSKGILNNSDLSQIDERIGVPIAFRDYARTFPDIDDSLIKELWKNIEDFL